MRIRGQGSSAFAETHESAGCKVARAQARVVEDRIAMVQVDRATAQDRQALMIWTCCFLLQFSVENPTREAPVLLEKRWEDLLRREEVVAVASHMGLALGASLGPDSAVGVANSVDAWHDSSEARTLSTTR